MKVWVLVGTGLYDPGAAVRIFATRQAAIDARAILLESSKYDQDYDQDFGWTEYIELEEMEVHE